MPTNIVQMPAEAPVKGMYQHVRVVANWDFSAGEYPPHTSWTLASAAFGDSALSDRINYCRHYEILHS